MANKKPNYLKLINGSAKQHPERHREDHLIPTPAGELGEAPDDFNASEVKAWNEVKSQLPAGVAFDSDRIAFEMLIRLVVKMRTADDIVASHYTQFISLSSRFGMTPSDRQRVKIPEKPKSGSFDDV